MQQLTVSSFMLRVSVLAAAADLTAGYRLLTQEADSAPGPGYCEGEGGAGAGLGRGHELLTLTKLWSSPPGETNQSGRRRR